MKWVRSLSSITGQAAIDGKTLRGSHDRGNGKKALHLVSAWASECRLVLGQVATDEKSNEITAIPELLQLPDLKGCLVTIDAMGCQTDIAAQIIEQEGDYLLAVKDNQKNLARDIAEIVIDSVQNRYYISGLTSDAHTLLRGSRHHWEIETSTHRLPNDTNIRLRPPLIHPTILAGGVSGNAAECHQLNFNNRSIRVKIVVQLYRPGAGAYYEYCR